MMRIETRKFTICFHWEWFADIALRRVGWQDVWRNSLMCNRSGRMAKCGPILIVW